MGRAGDPRRCHRLKKKRRALSPSAKRDEGRNLHAPASPSRSRRSCHLNHLSPSIRVRRRQSVLLSMLTTPRMQNSSAGLESGWRSRRCRRQRCSEKLTVRERSEIRGSGSECKLSRSNGILDLQAAVHRSAGETFELWGRGVQVVDSRVYHRPRPQMEGDAPFSARVSVSRSELSSPAFPPPPLVLHICNRSVRVSFTLTTPQSPLDIPEISRASPSKAVFGCSWVVLSQLEVDAEMWFSGGATAMLSDRGGWSKGVARMYLRYWLSRPV